MPSSVSRNLPESFDAADDQQEIVLAFERKHSIDKIVPRTLFAQLHFKSIGKEDDKFSGQQ